MDVLEEEHFVRGELWAQEPIRLAIIGAITIGAITIGAISLVLKSADAYLPIAASLLLFASTTVRD
jgi:hypothetical protein